MIKTERFSFVNDVPISGEVCCPSCKTKVIVNTKSCPKCGELVDLLRNREILLNWEIDLFNYKIDRIQDSLVFYSSRFAGNDYRNIYSLNERKNIIPESFTTYYLRYYKPGVVVISRFYYGKREYGMLDKEGNVIISPVCENIDDVDNRGNFIVKYNGKSGVNNIENKNIIPFVYDSIRRFSICNTDYYIISLAKKFGVINYKNEIVVPIVYDAIGEYSEGIVSLCKNGKWGYYNIDNSQIIIPFKYDKAEPFNSKVAKVKLGNYELYIDRDGFPTLPNTLSIKDGKVVIIDSNNNIIPQKIFDPHIRRSNVVPYKVNDKEGGINSDGVFVIPPIYDELYSEHSGLCVAKYGKSFGVLSIDGTQVMPFEYFSSHITEGLIGVRGKKEFSEEWFIINDGVFNRFGDVIIPLDYTQLEGFYEGLCFYEKHNHYGVMDKFGNRIEYRGVSENGKWVNTD